MDPYRPVRPFHARPDGFLDGGHCWIREYVTGGVFVVRMADSGMLEFSGPDGAFADGVPWPYRPAVTTLRKDLDREALRQAVEDVSRYAFAVLAPLGMGVPYDWDRMPSVFGRAIWDGDAEEYLPIDDVERIFEALGLSTIPLVEKEVPTRDVQVDASLVPASRVASAPAAGAVIQKKRGAAVAVRRDPFTDHERLPPRPAGRPESAAAWFEVALDRDRLGALASEQPIHHWDVDDLVARVGGELARREFASDGKLALAEPGEYRRVLRGRIVELRADTDGR